MFILSARAHHLRKRAQRGDKLLVHEIAQGRNQGVRFEGRIVTTRPEVISSRPVCATAATQAQCLDVLNEVEINVLSIQSK